MENQITKGKWQVNETGKTVLPDGTVTSQSYTISTTKDFYQKSIAKISAQSINDEKGLNKVLYSNETCLANAQLIAEAGNVTQETGKTPRQLADENKMLLEALKCMNVQLNQWIKQDESTIGYLWAKQALEAINKATK